MDIRRGERSILGTIYVHRGSVDSPIISAARHHGNHMGFIIWGLRSNNKYSSFPKNRIAVTGRKIFHAGPLEQ